MSISNLNWRLVLPFLLAVPPCALGQKSGARTAHNSAIDCSLSADGSYVVRYSATGWKLDGQLPEPVGKVKSTSGEDKVGRFHSLAISFSSGARRAEIRVYDSRPTVEFRDEWVSAGDNTTPFPTFAHVPVEQEQLSFQSINFGFYQFGKLNPEGPWVFFDKSAHALIVSPADHFLVSKMAADETGGATIGIDPEIKSMPAGFVHTTLLSTGDGVNDAFSSWGSALLAIGGKHAAPNNADALLNKLGYWTDNKTVYYYKFDESKGYAGTLLAVRDELKRLNVPIGYMQIDSWFYPKGPQSRWETKGNTPEFGETEYRADKTLFPDGMKKFQQNLGLPLVTHARWIAPQSPYHQQYKMSGNVAIDPRFWQSTADYLHDAGVITYEQDWLDKNAHAETNLTDPGAFLREMNDAMQAQNMSIQYCMTLPSDYMASTQYPAVRTTRTSGDGFERRKWDRFLYDSELAKAVGLWPWTDAFFSKDLGNLVISTLSAGPVGVGDAIGDFNVKNLMSVIRTDATIIKPDTPLVPIDDSYLRDSESQNSPMVAEATTATANGDVRYVFAYPRQAAETSVTIPLTKLGVRNPVFAYDWRDHTGSVLNPQDSLTIGFDSGWGYVVLTPVNAGGVALLGDTEKITPMGRTRISVEASHGGELLATVHFAAGEGPRVISGYAANQPEVKATVGSVTGIHFDPATHIFSIAVSAGTENRAVLSIRPPKS
ncbi:MAG TPA: hypothetical protein VGU25_17280 [Acidobacteriaceae bacterium]|nr:hypothetical protein [Acidobacteriaceae bacterium]